MAHGRISGRKVQYEAGYFTRDGDNARTAHTEGARDTIAGRLVLAPFAARPESPFAALQIGGAMASSRLDNQLGLRGVTVFGDGTFFDRVYVNGRRQRAGLDALWENGPFSVASELIVVNDQRKGIGLAGDDLPDSHAKGWYLAGTWTLTGEAKHGRVAPRHPFMQGGIGAIEVAARIEQMQFGGLTHPTISPASRGSDGLLGNSDVVTTLGMNWYLNRFIKVQPNLVIESIRDPERSPAPGAGGRFLSGVVRFHFSL